MFYDIGITYQSCHGSWNWVGRGIFIAFSRRKPVWSWKSEYCMVSEFNPWRVFLSHLFVLLWLNIVINLIVAAVMKWMILATWFKKWTRNLFLLSTLPKCCSSYTAINLSLLYSPSPPTSSSWITSPIIFPHRPFPSFLLWQLLYWPGCVASQQSPPVPPRYRNQ